MKGTRLSGMCILITAGYIEVGVQDITPKKKVDVNKGEEWQIKSKNMYVCKLFLILDYC